MSHGKPLALVLEDDESARQALAFLLRDWGAEVAEGVDGAVVMATLDGRAARARWLITDYNLGKNSNGVSAARGIVQQAPHIRVLVLTGSTGSNAEREAADAGFELLRKPVPPETILAWLERG